MGNVNPPCGAKGIIAPLAFDSFTQGWVGNKGAMAVAIYGYRHKATLERGIYPPLFSPPGIQKNNIGGGGVKIGVGLQAGPSKVKNGF